MNKLLLTCSFLTVSARSVGKNVGTTPFLADLALLFAPQVSDISASRAEGA